jgi:hypothetical protein
MPAITAPNSYLPGFKFVESNSNGSADAGDFANTTKYLCIPIASLPGLADAESHPTTGDMRKIMFALEDAVYEAYKAIDPTTDRPTKWINNRSSSVSDSSGVVTRNYNNQFFTEVSGEEVSNE